MSKKIVTFDFDSTLSTKIVQDFAKSLINKGIEVYVLTVCVCSVAFRQAKPSVKHNANKQEMTTKKRLTAIEYTRC